MKKLTFYFVAVFSLGLSTLSYASEGHVGEIRYSILAPEQFRTIYGPEWELMRGQEIPKDSDLLHLWGRATVPDARGLFLRCDNGPEEARRADGHQNPDTLRVGDLQGDQFRSHGHPLSLDGGELFLSKPIASCEFRSGMSGGGAFDDSGTRGITRGNPQTSPAGGNETRPKCLIVNAFIKMTEAVEESIGPSGRRPPSQKQKVHPSSSLTPEGMDALTKHPAFREAVKKIVHDIASHRKR